MGCKEGGWGSFLYSLFQTKGLPLHGTGAPEKPSLTLSFKLENNTERDFRVAHLWSLGLVKAAEIDYLEKGPNAVIRTKPPNYLDKAPVHQHNLLALAQTHLFRQ